MLIVAVVIVLANFIIGRALALRALPPLASTPLGKLCYWTATSLLGAALAVAVASVWNLVRELQLIAAGTVTDGDASVGSALTSVRSTALLSGSADILVRVGILVGLAAVVYVLGPPDRRA